jgi:hypothetical protein
VIAGCADVECGLVRVDEVGSPAKAECIRVEAFGDARVSKASEDGCVAKHSRCVVLMPGEAAACWEPAGLMNDPASRATRETALLTEFGFCPLFCE